MRATLAGDLNADLPHPSANPACYDGGTRPSALDNPKRATEVSVDPDRFDGFVRVAFSAGPRRTLLRLAGSGLAALLAGREPEDAVAAQRCAHHCRRKKHKRARRHCHRRCRQSQGCTGHARCSPGERCDGGACIACDVCHDATVCAFTSVAAAVRAATAGDIIHICPGSYPTREVVIDKRLTLTGAGSGKNGTVLDAGEQGRIFFVNLPEDDPDGPVQIARLTVTGGFLENAQDEGGGIFNKNGHLILDGAVVTRNVAPDGGGIFSDQAVTLVGGSRVEDNIALNVGGGIAGLTVTLNSGCLVTGNRAAEEGGGISAFGALTLNAGSKVTGNRAAFKGGGILMAGALRLEAGSEVTGNRAESGGGGGVYMNFGHPAPVNNGRIANNHPDNCAGEPLVPRCPA